MPQRNLKFLKTFDYSPDFFSQILRLIVLILTFCCIFQCSIVSCEPEKKANILKVNIFNQVFAKPGNNFTCFVDAFDSSIVSLFFANFVEKIYCFY